MEIKEAILDIELSMVKDFLASFDLRYESDIDKTLYIEEDGNVYTWGKGGNYQLGNYETNRSEPSLEVLKKMSKVYSISIDRMLGNSMSPNKYEKDHPEIEKEYVDIEKVLKVLEEYAAQEKSKNNK